jgi:benzoylformate decarboxylase
MKLIVALHEGQAVSMAQGYELASGKTAALSLPSIGMPNAMSNLYNAWKDRSSLAVFSDGQNSNVAGRDGFQQVDDWLQPTESFTKWRWQVNHPERIGEMVRRAIKLAGTPPGGPVYVRLPKDILRKTKIQQTIYPQSSFNVPVAMEPKTALIEEATQLLINAKAPVINVGGEVTRAGAGADVLELAELLSIPVAQGSSVFGDFPYGHPLFAGFSVGGVLPTVRQSDVFLNLGASMPDPTNFGAPVPTTTKVINARVEYNKIANIYPSDTSIAAGMKEIVRALIDSIQSAMPRAQMEAVRSERLAQAQANSAAAARRRRQRAQPTWEDSPIAAERLAYELDQGLEDDAILVTEGSGRTYFEHMDFAPDKKTAIGPTTGFALGWTVGAALGVKIARPDRQVVALVGDGAMLFGQLEALWTASRYDIPIMIVVLNNRSYDSERQALYLTSNLAKTNKEMWKDMSCYLGNPIVDFVSIARGFDIKGQSISEPDKIPAALQRASEATRDGRPYLLDVAIAQRGPGANTNWHPEISIASERTRKV